MAPKHLVVIGGGVIGLELGSVWRRLGAKVTVIEFMPTILPGMDEELVKDAERTFKKQGLVLRTGSKVTGARREGDTMIVDVEKDGATETLEADYVFVSVGRKPSLTGVDAAALGVHKPRRPQASPLFRLVSDHVRRLQTVYDERFPDSKSYPGVSRRTGAFVANESSPIRNDNAPRVRSSHGCATCRAQVPMLESRLAIRMCRIAESRGGSGSRGRS